MVSMNRDADDGGYMYTHRYEYVATTIGEYRDTGVNGEGRADKKKTRPGGQGLIDALSGIKDGLPEQSPDELQRDRLLTPYLQS